MESAPLLKANSSLLSKWRHGFHGNLFRTRSANFISICRFATKNDKTRTSYRFSGVKFQSVMRSKSNFTGKSNSVVQFNFDEQFINSSCSDSKGNSEEKSAIDTIYKIIKSLKIPAVLMVQSLLLLLMFYGRNSALARATGEDNVSVLTSDSVGNQNKLTCNCCCCCKKNGAKEDVNSGKSEISESEDKIIDWFSLIIFLIMLTQIAIIAYKMTQFGVIMVQMNVDSGSGSFLDGTALRADTSTSEGRGEMLIEATHVIRSYKCSRAGYSSVKMFNKIEDAEKYFQHLSTDERGKFDDQLVYMNYVDKERIRKSRSDCKIKHAVVTILVIAKGKGVCFFPNNIVYKRELFGALLQLKKMSQFGQADIHALTMFCTRQQGKEPLSMKEICQEYPLLKTLNPAL